MSEVTVCNEWPDRFGNPIFRLGQNIDLFSEDFETSTDDLEIV
jgi:hypothetical protein